MTEAAGTATPGPDRPEDPEYWCDRARDLSERRASAPGGPDDLDPTGEDEHHAAMHEDVARLFATLPGWDEVPEVTFSEFGERGSIDILAWHAAHTGSVTADTPPLCPPFWRGRMGLDKDKQLALFSASAAATSSASNPKA